MHLPRYNIPFYSFTFTLMTLPVFVSAPLGSYDCVLCVSGRCLIRLFYTLQVEYEIFFHLQLISNDGSVCLYTSHNATGLIKLAVLNASLPYQERCH